MWLSVDILRQAPIALQRVEPPNIQYTTAQLSTVTEASACPAPGKRRLVPGTNIPYPPVSETIRKRQELFQVRIVDYRCKYY